MPSRVGWAAEFAHVLGEAAWVDVEGVDEFGGWDKGSAVFVEVVGEVVDGGERFGSLPIAWAMVA